MSESLVAALERNALKFGERLAVSYPAGNVTLTWEELYRRSTKLAQHLNEQGINKGDSVALLIPNRPSFVIALFAIFQLGARAVPINVRLTPNEINYILDNSDAVSLLYDNGLKEIALEAAEGINLRYVETTDNFEKIYEACQSPKVNCSFSSEDAAEKYCTLQAPPENQKE